MEKKSRLKNNLPNILTISRIFFIPYFLVFLFSNFKYGKIIALFVFVLASITDLLDGRIARKQGSVSEFGKVMDPIADKLLVLSAFISFVQLDLISTWMVMVIIAREFLITSLRMVAVSKKGTVLAAISSGKHKTVWHITTIITILVILAIQDFINTEIGHWHGFLLGQGDTGEFFVALFKWLPDIMTMICVVYSVFSAVDFINKNRKVIFE
jgi:CDP-diacylglycerol--glycerol-3-phosphate 3-phosphatidyltransferase